MLADEALLISERWYLYRYYEDVSWRLIVHRHKDGGDGSPTDYIIDRRLSDNILRCAECNDAVPREVEDVGLLAGVDLA